MSRGVRGRIVAPVEKILDRPATLSGEDVLPGFVLELNEIWSAD